MKHILLFSLFITSFRIAAAQDTTYLDKSQRISSRENAAFYRITAPEDTLFRAEMYYLSGKLQSVLYYRNKELSVLQGPAQYYYADGNRDSEGSFKDNLRSGKWKFYFPNGKLSGFIYFKDGKVATADYLERYGHMMDDNNDAQPSFRGGKEALIEYIRKTFDAVQKQAKEKIKGTVKVAFIVSETGKITNVHLVSGINDQIDQQAIKLINGMPDWHPGIQYDKPVRVPLILPIVF